MMTEQERDKLVENLHKIADYVRSNYIPMLRQCDSLSVQFGEFKYYPCSYTREYEHSFGGLATTVTFGTGQAVWDSISAMTP